MKNTIENELQGVTDDYVCQESDVLDEKSRTGKCVCACMCICVCNL